MDRYLLDVNVLLALFDPSHLNHDEAHVWWSQTGKWASCPITENGFARVISNPRYPKVETTATAAFKQLHEFAHSSDHQFWEDSISLRAQPLPALGAQQITDYYLAALAKIQNSKLATFDKKFWKFLRNSELEANIELIG